MDEALREIKRITGRNAGSTKLASWGNRWIAVALDWADKEVARTWDHHGAWEEALNQLSSSLKAKPSHDGLT